MSKKTIAYVVQVKTPQGAWHDIYSCATKYAALCVEDSYLARNITKQFRTIKRTEMEVA